MAPQSAARLKANGRLKAAARNGRRVTAGPAGPTLWAAADPMLQCSSRKFLRFCRHVWLATAASPTRLRDAWMLRRRLVLIYPFWCRLLRTLRLQNGRFGRDKSPGPDYSSLSDYKVGPADPEARSRAEPRSMPPPWPWCSSSVSCISTFGTTRSSFLHQIRLTETNDEFLQGRNSCLVINLR